MNSPDDKLVVDAITEEAESEAILFLLDGLDVESVGELRKLVEDGKRYRYMKAIMNFSDLEDVAGIPYKQEEEGHNAS